ncbi:hypothetical protein ruthe_01679 [Rubellimicrobium thermophilum DSM 16684]|uniref:Uncharacterized protein n=1 Tax=Rubellimicrobium thermophilum DSM 16684 TaxID=1123069 RepID=S9R233_9RHOB|nr:hypothetical protein ruthe_01679 [Rubellimicrobium thermophilum DSM 16684]
MRRWSVPRWPDAAAAMSDITTSACPPEPGLDLFLRALGQEVEDMDLGARHRFDRLQIEAQHPPDRLAGPLAQGIHPRHGNLCPPSWRAAQIDHPRTGLQKAEAVVDLDQLVGRARAIAFGLCAPDIGVVELPFEPAGRGQLAPLGGLHAHRQIAPSACGGPAGRCSGHGAAPCAARPSPVTASYGASRRGREPGRPARRRALPRRPPRGVARIRGGARVAQRLC